ncbi:MAG TPA: MBL fold metallo-hydrolase [Acidimicrobiales bacterium]|nr:MBL fold metallo-hydrolase [Acidimicrobiales bacterium]
MRIGDLEVLPLSDGTAKLPKGYFPNAQWTQAHDPLFGDDGRMHLPIGCFVVRTSDTIVLVDAGIGPVDLGWLAGGDLPGELASVGVRPEDIDIVVCTHLHLDHAGWLVEDGTPFFPNATVRFGAGDWQRWVLEAPEDDRIRNAMLLLDARGRLEAIDTDGETIAPGITARAAPGHTMGQHILVLSSGDQRAMLLGDAVTCPIQLTEEDWYGISDMDAALADRTRRALWDELEGTDTQFTAAHFPGLQFGRLLRGDGKRFFA